MFTKIGHILEEKTDLHEFKRFQVLPNVSSDHSGIKFRNQ